jgi:3-hydroxyisobutyrate dehydrogenase
MKVGVCGIGRMGAALAERLIELGHEVQVWNRTASRCDPLVAQGVKQAASPAELGEACEATFVIVRPARRARMSSAQAAPTSSARLAAP